MTDYEYDPKTPFAFVGYGSVYARFTTLYDAQKWRDIVGAGEVIDTTPKPKIPEDAEFITWPDLDERGYFMAARRLPETHRARSAGNEWIDQRQVWHTEKSLVGAIGDAEVTVLVRKEGTL